MLYVNAHITWAVAYYCSWLCLKEGESRMPAGNSGSWKKSNAKILHHLFLKIKQRNKEKKWPSENMGYSTLFAVEILAWLLRDTSREIGAEKKEQNVESKRSKELESMKRNQGQRWQGGDGRAIDGMAEGL